MNSAPRSGKKLGRKIDRLDRRDLMVFGCGIHITHGGAYQQAGAPLPSHVDVFSGLNLPVYDQGSEGSCTANAGVLYRRFLAQKFPLHSSLDKPLSRQFLYEEERLLPWNNDPASDSGASVRDTFYVLAHIGVCSEEDDSYIAANFDVPVTPAMRVSAAGYKIGAYHRIPDVATARSVLASGYAIDLGFVTYPSFEDIGADGVMPMPKKGDQLLGGHAVVIRGYDDERAAFYIQNSWGPAWGASGCFWMPYAFLDDAALSQFDMWMGHLGKPWR